MITEDYVSFETAKLLKKKGFENNEPTCINVFKGHIYRIQDKEIIADDDVTIPTLQMAMKWLREVHNIFISIFQIESTTVTMEQEYFFYRIQKNRRTINIIPDTFKEPEQACEAAIKYCLKNLI